MCYRKLTSVWNTYKKSNSSINNSINNNNNSDSSSSNNNDIEIDTNIYPVIQPGILLVAHPLLTGPLRHSVILVLEHDDNCTYGIKLHY
jgi:hypothetical protein